MNLCLSLVTHGLEDTAFHILKNFPPLQLDNSSLESVNLGNFFLRHCVNMDTVFKDRSYPNLNLYKLHYRQCYEALLCLCFSNSSCFFLMLFALQSLEKIARFCKELQEENLHTSPLTFTLSCALEAKKTGNIKTHLSTFGLLAFKLIL